VVTVAVDCMGGDHGPRVTLAACRQFLKLHPRAQLLLVGLPEALSPDAIVTHPGLEGMINGANGTRRTGYFGPRPPADGKVHTYNFRIYALDYELNLPEGYNKQALLEAMEVHILATGLLTGNYQYSE